MRDKEDRVRFSGYDVASFKIFIFCLAAALSRPSAARCSRCRSASCRRRFVGIVPSIEMVIFAAVGGRMSLLGAVYGTLLVNFGKTYFSESFPDLWLFLMGGLFIGVVHGLPQRPGRRGRHPGTPAAAGDASDAARSSRSQRRQRPPSAAEPHRTVTGLEATNERRHQFQQQHAIGGITSNRPVLAVEDLTVSFDGFKAVDDLTLYVDRNEVRVDHRPQRRRQDHAARPDLRQDRGDLGQHQVQGHRADEDARARDRARRRRPQVPDAVDLREPDRVREPGDVVPARPHGVRRAGLQAQPGRGRAGRGGGARRSAWPTSWTPRPACCRTARSSGWRSACC